MSIERLLPPLIILAVALWVAFVSFTGQPAEGFAFPRLISVGFVGLAVAVLIQALMSNETLQPMITLSEVKWIAPGLLIATLYVFWIAKGLGFYTAAALAVFGLMSIYDPNPHNSAGIWLKRGLITWAFVAVMYVLFAVLLGVFTPKEFLFR